MIATPERTEAASYYFTYIDRVPAGDIRRIIRDQEAEVVAFAESISEEQSRHRYAPDKWSIREVVGHMIDAERVFGYRALRFARNDRTPLPGFDENAYAPESGADRRTLADLADEYEALRRSHILFFRALAEAAWSRVGTANDTPMSVRALAWVMAGHGRHHSAVIRERYL